MISMNDLVTVVAHLADAVDQLASKTVSLKAKTASGTDSDKVKLTWWDNRQQTESTEKTVES